jgi:small GTP-binding protein
MSSPCFDPDGQILASAGDYQTIRLWTVGNGKLLTVLPGNADRISQLAWSPDGEFLAAACGDSLRVWHRQRWDLVHVIDYPSYSAGGGVAWAPNSKQLVYSGLDTLILDVETETVVTGLRSKRIGSLTWSPNADATLIAGTRGHAVAIWDTATNNQRDLEVHSGPVRRVAFSPDGRLLVSLAEDELFVWRCRDWEVVERIPGFSGGLAFHQSTSRLATAFLLRSELEIQIWEVNTELLLTSAAAEAVTYTTAKIVLVGDSGVGKTGLGWRLAYGRFKEHASTHGQQFWTLNQLRRTLTDGTQCEAILWDLAGQPDYRLTHALFVDDADVALLLFDPTRTDDPLHGIEYWLKQLRIVPASVGRTSTILVAGRADRGSSTLTRSELDKFCQERGIGCFISSSASSGEGIDELLEYMKRVIPWNEKVATVTTETFKRIKDYVLELKELRDGVQVIVDAQQLRQRLEAAHPKWHFTDSEIAIAVGHLENHGYVKRLRASAGDIHILLAPELLNNLGASIVLEARRNPKGLGSLEEKRLLAGEYPFPEIAGLSLAQRSILIDAATLLFLEHNICFRETDPLTSQSYLVFPDLINLKRPAVDGGEPTTDDVAYTVTGAIENVYASLVVLLGYTQTFTRTNQWQRNAQYQFGEDITCGFRLEQEREGELDFVLYFGKSASAAIRHLFQGLFESFLARRNVTVTRYEPVLCTLRHLLDRAVVRKHVDKGQTTAYCNECGEKMTLALRAPIQLTMAQQAQVTEQRRFAEQRTRFEQALVHLRAHVEETRIRVPECFLSYAWGDSEHERWVEHHLARDLQKAGITVVLDRWDNGRIGSSVPRFIERIQRSDRVLVVGTPLYRQKYANVQPMGGYVAAAEGDLIGLRMIGTEERKESVLPVLLAGTADDAFPPLLQGRVYADFRDPDAYFPAIFDLIVSLYEIRVTDEAVADLRTSIRQGVRFTQGA